MRTETNNARAGVRLSPGIGLFFALAAMCGALLWRHADRRAYAPIRAFPDTLIVDEAEWRGVSVSRLTTEGVVCGPRRDACQQSPRRDRGFRGPGNGTLLFDSYAGLSWLDSANHRSVTWAHNGDLPGQLRQVIDIRLAADSSVLVLDLSNASLTTFSFAGAVGQVREYASTRGREQVLDGETIIGGAIASEAVVLLTLADGDTIGTEGSAHLVFAPLSVANPSLRRAVPVAIRTRRVKDRDLQPPTPQFMPKPFVAVVDSVNAGPSTEIWLVSDREAGRIETYDLMGHPKRLILVRALARAPTAEERESTFTAAVHEHYPNVDSASTREACVAGSGDIVCQTIFYYRRAKDMALPVVPFATSVVRAGAGIWIRSFPAPMADSTVWTLIDRSGRPTRRLSLAVSDRIEDGDANRVLVSKLNRNDRREPRELAWRQIEH